MSKRPSDAAIKTTPQKTSRFSRHPNHKSSPTKEPVRETVTVDHVSVPLEGDARAYMAAFFLGRKQLAFASKCFDDDNKDKLLSKDHRFIGVYSLREAHDESSYVAIGDKGYAIKTFLFVCDGPESRGT